MSSDTTGSMSAKVYTTDDGRTVIEQSKSSIVLTADQIPEIIKELQVCYDYCASWKDAMREQDRAVVSERKA
jgi:hypothetical protein